MKPSLTSRPRVVLYLRVSTKEQTTNYSLQTQEFACKSYCKANDYEIVRVFREQGESAKTASRTEFTKLIEFCTAKNSNIQYVVVYDLTRWSRNAEDSLVYQAMLYRKGVGLRSTRENVDETPQGKFMLTMFSGIAQLDNDVKSQRTKLGMRQALETGRWTWKPPLGYLRLGAGRDSKLVPDPAKADLVRRAFEMFATGLHSKQHVLSELSAQGLRRATGRPMTSQDFHRVLTNQIYIGIVHSPTWNESHTGLHEPLIDRETFDRVQAILSGKRASVVPHLRNRVDFPLRNFVRCGACHRPLTGYYAKKKYAYYACHHRQCRTAKAPRHVVEDAFIRLLEEQQPEPAYLKLFGAIVRDVWRQKNREADLALAACRQQIGTLKDRKDKLIDAMLDGKLSDIDYHDRLDRLNDEIERSRALETEKHIEQLDVEVVLTYAEHLLLNTARVWLDATLDQKQRLQRVIFPNGVEYLAGEIRTSGMASIFSALREIVPLDAHLASPTGFEPVLSP